MQSKKIVIDTNVLISSIIGKGYSKQILQIIFLNKNLLLCTSESCNAEFEKVLKYKRLAKYPEIKSEGNKILEEIIEFGIQYYPSVEIFLLKDKSDNKFLELAKEAKAHYLITGNHLHFNLENFEGTKILSPKKFYELYEQNNL